MKGRIACLLGLVLLIGCADVKEMNAVGKKMAGDQEGRAREDAAREPGKAKPAQPARPRKVIYNGQMDLIVDDFDQARQQLKEVVESYKGLIDRSEVTGEPGQPRSGTWTLRVPAADFEPFMDAVAGLGEARRRKKETTDVTDRYYDTEAEALNLEAREKALRKLYDQKIAGTKLAELMEVDRELYAVRGEINTRRGQMKRWDNQVGYSTLELSMRDRKGYVPPESPAFGTTVGRAFSRSIDALVATGKALVLVAVVVAPWLGVMVALGLVVGLPLRARLRRRPAAPPREEV